MVCLSSWAHHNIPIRDESLWTASPLPATRMMVAWFTITYEPDCPWTGGISVALSSNHFQSFNQCHNVVAIGFNLICTVLWWLGGTCIGGGCIPCLLRIGCLFGCMSHGLGYGLLRCEPWGTCWQATKPGTISCVSNSKSRILCLVPWLKQHDKFH